MIATDVGGIKEYADEKGVILIKKDGNLIPNLAKAIDGILDDPIKAAQMGRYCEEHAQQFDVKKDVYKRQLYSNACIYTLPSDLEGMPLSLLEAMSYGNCCLVSDIPECAEVVEDKAMIFKKSNVDALREKLQEACDHPAKAVSYTHLDVYKRQYYSMQIK